MIHGIACTSPHLKTWKNNAVLVSFAYYNKVKITSNRITNRKCSILK